MQGATITLSLAAAGAAASKNALEKLFRPNSMVYLWSGAGCTTTQSFAIKGMPFYIFTFTFFKLS